MKCNITTYDDKPEIEASKLKAELQKRASVAKNQ